MNEHQGKSQSNTYPHFLGIGAQKAGTSWLDKCLRKHPEIWLPPEKEIHYFDRSPSYASPSYLYPDQPILRFEGKDSWNEEFRAKCIGIWKTHTDNPEVLRWYFNYLLLPCSDSWYASLFEEGRDKIRGEITPAYSILNETDIALVQSLMPTAKILFILRNPVDRAWSHFRHLVGLSRINPHVSFDDFKDWVDGPGQQQRSAYMQTIKRWSAFFPEEQIFVGFYDDIVLTPENFLSRVLTFLEVGANGSTVDAVMEHTRINFSPEIEIPDQFRQYLHEKYREDIDQLARQLGGAAENWRKT